MKMPSDHFDGSKGADPNLIVIESTNSDVLENIISS
jgi:hypothetical protein